MGHRWRVAALVGAVLFVFTSLAPVPAEIRVSPLDRYGESVAEGEVPYRDFSLEYPPGALPPVVVPALVPGVSYSAAFRAGEVALGVLLVLCTAYLLRDARRVELVASSRCRSEPVSGRVPRSRGRREGLCRSPRPAGWLGRRS